MTSPSPFRRVHALHGRDYDGAALLSAFSAAMALAAYRLPHQVRVRGPKNLLGSALERLDLPER